MRIDDALAGVKLLGLDTTPFIYFVEAHPDYDDRVTRVFESVASKAPRAVTSVVTLCEVLVHPIRTGNATLSAAYRDILLRGEGLSVLPIYGFDGGGRGRPPRPLWPPYTGRAAARRRDGRRLRGLPDE